MKIIYRIAKLELNTLFYSPIAWFLAIIFMFQGALSYLNLLNAYFKLEELGGGYLDYLTFLTGKIMGGSFGLYSTMISKLYLYIPLLTMGLISRELSSGTIKLVYSSPVKVRQLILGKFFAMMAYNLLLIAILLIFVFCAAFQIRAADPGVVCSGILGIFLLLCAYSAIGLFMSCLTSYQIVAAISTLVVFAMLAYVGQLWQGIDFVRNLTYFLSINGRTGHFLVGLIETKDLIYFVVITLLFLSFAVIKLRSDRETKPISIVAGRYLFVFVLALIIGYFSGLPGLIGYMDVTRGKQNTLTPNTQKVIAQIGDEPMEVTFYANILDQRFRIGSPESRNEDLDRWSYYLRFKPNIKLNYVYYYAMPLDPNENFEKYYPGKTAKQIAQQYAETYMISFDRLKTKAEIDKIIDLKPELYRCVMQVKYRGKVTFLRLYDDQTTVPTEPEITAAFKRLTTPVPRVAFLEGEYERGIDKLGSRDYGAITKNIVFRYALINQGFDVESISLKEQEIPTDITALVIGDPRAGFSPEVLGKIQKYISDGGNLLIAGESDKREVLLPLLQPLGVKMMDGLLLQTTKDNPLSVVKPLFTRAAADLSGSLEEAFADSEGIRMPGVVGLSYDANGSFKVKPLLMTDQRTTWNKKGKIVLDSAAIEYSAANGDDHRSISPLLALTRNVNGKEQRIIVAGDADFLTTAAISNGGRSHFNFNTQLFRWFTYGQFPIDASRPPSLENWIKMTRPGMSILKIVLLGVLPGLLLLFGTVFLIRRKRK